MDRPAKPRVVIVGAGFGGLWAARGLAKKNVDVLIVDRNNYHTFLALLYQVAAAELEAADIAYPVRSVFWGSPNINFALGDVSSVDLQNRCLKTGNEVFYYDYLILSAGSVSHSYGVPGVESFSYYLKTLEEAVALKNHIIRCFETAARETDEAKRRRLLTFAIVGGGATGVEYAGALSELVYCSLRRDYPTVDIHQVQILLLEAADRLVANMPEKVRAYTLKRLQNMKVNVQLGVTISEVTEEAVILQGRDAIPTATVIWSAGVRGEPVAAASGFPTERDGRVRVLPTLQVPGCPEVYVVGDLAAIAEQERLLPMVAQVAIQSGVAAGRNIMRQIGGEEPQPFQYRDRGSMIAIGRNAAGVAIGKHNYTGFLAWILWLFVHLFNLIGFRNRMMVLINWAWDYLLFERAVRFIFPSARRRMKK